MEPFDAGLPHRRSLGYEDFISFPPVIYKDSGAFAIDLTIFVVAVILRFAFLVFATAAEAISAQVRSEVRLLLTIYCRREWGGEILFSKSGHSPSRERCERRRGEVSGCWRSRNSALVRFRGSEAFSPDRGFMGAFCTIVR